MRTGMDGWKGVVPFPSGLLILGLRPFAGIPGEKGDGARRGVEFGKA